MINLKKSYISFCKDLIYILHLSWCHEYFNVHVYVRVSSFLALCVCVGQVTHATLAYCNPAAVAVIGRNAAAAAVADTGLAAATDTYGGLNLPRRAACLIAWVARCADSASVTGIPAKSEKTKQQIQIESLKLKGIKIYSRRNF